MHLFLLFYLFVYCSNAEDMIEEPKIQESSNEQEVLPRIDDLPGSEDVINAIEKMEQIAASAEKSRREGILPGDHSEELYNKMVETLTDLVEILKNPQNTYKFLNKKGVDRIITPMIGVNYDPLKRELLILIKTLFDVTPTTTNVLLPAHIIDKLLDIFENDNNLELKTLSLDIMSSWLPNNPTLQTRVMRLKGLEPFYKATKLDSLVKTLLDLFNTILKEHLNAKKIYNREIEVMKLYQVIGFVELISTPNVCNGILNIINNINNIEDDYFISIFELIKNIKPFCLSVYKGKAQAIKVFDDLNNIVIKRSELLDDLNLNGTEIRMLLDDYVRDVKGYVRDEF